MAPGLASFAAASRAGGVQRAVRVLIVEDDKDTALSMLMLLGTEGYDARAVGSADQCREGVREFSPDAVLLDIGLPGRSGYEVARELRSRHGKDLLLIAVTAWKKPSDRILAQLAGFDFHVAKPYDPVTLLGLLEPLRSSPTN